MIAQIYVDDIVLGGMSNKMVQHFVQQMQSEFEMSLVSELFWLNLWLKGGVDRYVCTSVCNIFFDCLWSFPLVSFMKRSICMRMCIISMSILWKSLEVDDCMAVVAVIFKSSICLDACLIMCLMMLKHLICPLMIYTWSFPTVCKSSFISIHACIQGEY